MMKIRDTLFFLPLFLSLFLNAQQDTVPAAAEKDLTLPVFNLSSLEVDEGGQSQDISGLLQSSSDIFVSTAGYTFGPARFRIRGYDSENTAVMINGVQVNDMESGWAYWSSWGGLNDALRNQDVNTGISPSSSAFGGPGGVTNIATRASIFSKGVKVSYALANRTYRNRLMVTASTGVMKNGWSFVVSGSRRWAQEGYVEGTFYDAWSYFLSAEKKINDKHSIGFTGFGAPSQRGMAGVSVQEAYDLAGSNYYNPNWGYQDGEVRNARVGNYHQPMMILSHYWKIAREKKLNTSVYYSFGRGGSTALNWTEAGDPRPDYYKNLPSYFYYLNEYDKYEYYQNQWRTNEEFRQVNWDHMYFANSKYLYTVKNANGISGNDMTILRSKYIIEDRRNDKSQWGITSNFSAKATEHMMVNAGINISIYKGFHFNVVEDLLGGQYWLDIDKYAGNEPFVITDEAQSDLNHPNRLAEVGDKISHDYTANVNYYSGFYQEQYTFRKIDFFWAANISHTTFWRTGHMRNGRFPDNSYGDSKKQNFTNFGFKGGATYKINGKNFIDGNALYMTRAPFFRNAYISPRTRDYLVDPLKNEKILSGDISFIHRSLFLKTRLTAYYTQFYDQTWTRSFYHEDLNTFVNYIMTGVDQLNAGMELGIEANVTPSVSLLGVFGTGQYIYNSRPNVTIVRDNDDQVIVSDEEAWLKNYYVGGMPQTVGSLGIKYNSSHYWFIELKGNYFDDIYLEPNPARRTELAVEKFSQEDIRVQNILEQEELNNAFTIDIFGGKSWRIKDNYFAGFTLSINNLLDTKDFATGGFEQLRFDQDNIDRFPPKYFYMYGRTYYLNVYFRFQ